MKDNTIQFDSNIAQGNSNIRVAFYANIGFLIEVVQMLEFNLRKLLCYHLSVNEIEKNELTKENVLSICKKYDDYYFKTYTDKWTLGQLKGEISKLNLLKDDIIGHFTEINDYRVLIVHKVFQNNIISHALEDAQKVSDYNKQRLIPMTNKAIACNNLVIKIIGAYRDDLRSYKRQFNIPCAD